MRPKGWGPEGWPQSRRGFTRQPENSKRATFQGPALQNKGRKNENCGGRGKKRAKIWAVRRRTVVGTEVREKTR